MEVIRLYDAFPVCMPALSFLGSVAEDDSVGSDDMSVTTTSTAIAEPSQLRIRTPEYDESEYADDDDDDDEYDDDEDDDEYTPTTTTDTPIDLTEITLALLQAPPLSPPRDLPAVARWRPPTPDARDEPPVMRRQTAVVPRSEQETIQFILSQLPSPPAFSLSLLPLTPVVEWGVKTPPRSASSVRFCSPIRST